MFIKKVYLFIIFHFIIFKGFSQFPCSIDAGGINDVVCFTEDTLILLGGNPTAIGGQPPYSYSWKTTWSFGDWSDIEFHASDFLNDTTIANPILTSIAFGEELIFTLTVTDFNGNICIDSVKTSSPYFSYPIEPFSVTMQFGDSVTVFPPFSEGVQPLQYNWTPSFSLLNDTIEIPLAHPENSTAYLLTVTDANGCSTQSQQYSSVNVSPLSVNNLVSFQYQIQPNPFRSGINIAVPSRVSVKSIELFSSKGSLINKYNSQARLLNMESMSTGIYFLKINTNEGIIMEKIVKQ